MGNICFYDNVVQQTLKFIKESHELFDTSQDIQRVEQMMMQVRYSSLMYSNMSDRQLKLQQARMLDDEMRQKYQGIEEMVRLANALPHISMQRGMESGTTECNEYNRLGQDRYGIIWHVLVKHKITNKIEDFVERVEGD